MRRHMKLVRLLLEHAEAQCNGHWYNPPELKDYGASEVEYHVRLCQEAGYIVAQVVASPVVNGEPDRYQMGRLTWAGHEELDRLRG